MATDPLTRIERLASQLIRRLTIEPIEALFGSSQKRTPDIPGAPPDALRIGQDAQVPVITVHRINPENWTRRDDLPVEDLPEATRGAQTVWIDIVGFGDPALLTRLAQTLGIHSLALAGAINHPQRPRVESFDDHHLILTHMPHLDTESGAPGLVQIGMILRPGQIVTFRERDDGALTSLESRLEKAGSRLRSEPADYLAYALLDLATDSFFPVVETLVEQIDQLEDSILENDQSPRLPDLHRHRRALMSLGRILWRQRDMIGQLLRSDEQIFRSGTHIYLRDVHDHAVQLMDLVETARELISSLVEIHLTSINNRTNEVMKTLTIMASIFIPLTFVVGIYGMNFEHMPELAWRWAYPTVMGFMLVVAGGLLLWFWKRGWMG